MQIEKLLKESSIHSAIVSELLRDLYAGRRIIDLSVETTKDDSLYESVEHLDRIADTVRKLL
jgi:hypothetical protein